MDQSLSLSSGEERRGPGKAVNFRPARPCYVILDKLHSYPLPGFPHLRMRSVSVERQDSRRGGAGSARPGAYYIPQAQGHLQLLLAPRGK